MKATSSRRALALWAAVGCRSVWKGQKKPQLDTAANGVMVKDVKGEKPFRKLSNKASRKATQAEKMAAPSPEPGALVAQPQVAAAVVERDDGDGVVRVRDEFADDLSAWGDY